MVLLFDKQLVPFLVNDIIGQLIEACAAITCVKGQRQGRLPVVAMKGQRELNWGGRGREGEHKGVKRLLNATS